jgi:antitoxin ParD1/3/4
MPTISVSLGKDLEGFVRDEVASGRYRSASEVIEEGLRALEERNRRLEALRAHLAEGAEQAQREEFVEYSLQSLIAELDGKA